MTTRQQMANAVYRDFVVDGVPSSGANEPVKAEIRAYEAVCNAQLDALVAAAATPGEAINLLLGIAADLATETATRETADIDLQAQIEALSQALTYRGAWNANTNSPALVSGVGTLGDYYIVSTAGTTTLDGISSWSVGDKVIFGPTAWVRIPNVSAVTSVAGRTGAITLAAADVSGVARDGRGFYDASLHGVLPANLAAANVSAMQTLITTAVAAGVTTIYLPAGEHDLTGIDATIHKVRLIGPGTIKGVYRKQVEPNRAQNTFKSAQTLVPALHMRRFLATRNPVVVIVGDSLSLPNELDDTSPRNGIFEIVSEKLRQTFPEKEITIYSRGIGGARFYDLDGVWPGTLPSWYTNPATAWLDYIRDLNPDLVVLHFGMNDGYLWDSGNFPPANFFSVVAKMRGWQKEPELVFCTPVVPSLYGTLGGTDYRSEAQQEGRDAVAGFLRAVCDLGHYGYVDQNRWFNVMRDGRDILSRGLSKSLVTATQTIPLIPTEKTRDYVLQAEFTNIPSSFWLNGTDVLAVSLSPLAANVALISNNGGFLKIDVYIDGTRLIYSETSTIATPATGTDVTLLYKVIGDRLFISVNGATLFDGPIIRFGGMFYPYFKYYLNTASTASGTFKLLSSKETVYPSVMLDTEIYGSMPGGNAVNHPAGEALQLIHQEPMNAQPWSYASGLGPEEKLLDLLHADTGFAIDFVLGKYVIRSLTNPALNAYGDIASVVVNALTYATHAVTGERVGLSISGASVNHILTSSIPFSTTEGTLLIEGLATAAANTYFASIGPATAYGPRLDVYSATGAELTYAVVDDASAVVANGNISKNPVGTFSRIALSWKANAFDFVVDGHLFVRDRAGAIPTGLDRIRLGYASAPAPNPLIIRRLVLIPAKLGPLQLMARTI